MNLLVHKELSSIKKGFQHKAKNLSHKLDLCYPAKVTDRSNNKKSL